MIWQPAPDDLVDFVAKNTEEAPTEMRYLRLSFYLDGYLVEAQTTSGKRRFVLGGVSGELKLVPLDGCSDQIHCANHYAGLVIDRENAADYAKFFCRHLNAEYGNFRLIETLSGQKLDTGHTLRNMKVRVGHQDTNGAFMIGAYSFYAETVFRVSLRVHLDGNVVMLKDQSMGELITLQ